MKRIIIVIIIVIIIINITIVAGFVVARVIVIYNIIYGVGRCFRRGRKSSRRYEIGFSPGAMAETHCTKRAQQRLQLYNIICAHIIISLPR